MRRFSRGTLLVAGLVLLVLVAVLFSFRSPPRLVDTAQVKRGPFQVTLEEEGRTRLPDRYAVSVPVAGYIQRVTLEPGDQVEQGQPLFMINPSPAEPLDARSSAQAEASLARSKAALEAAQTEVEAARAQAELTRKELSRTRRLVEGGHLPSEQLDYAQADARAADARLRSAQFGVDVARHELEGARAALEIAGGDRGSELLAIQSPINGVVLTRERQSEGRVQPGETILTLGDLNSLQVEVDLLSPDAVRLQPGMRVELERWGGEATLPGRVRRIDPAGFTHISALGVEEQRVWVVVDFDSPRDDWQRLGDAYRIEARFILWEGENILQVPASAVFREGDTWATYVVENGRAVRRELEPGRRSGLMTEVRSGLEVGEEVILHPGQSLEAGQRVRGQRF